MTIQQNTSFKIVFQQSMFSSGTTRAFEKLLVLLF